MHKPNQTPNMNTQPTPPDHSPFIHSPLSAALPPSPIKALPPPHQNWRNGEHFLRTMDGLLNSAREFLTPEEHRYVLEAVGSECARRLAAAGPQLVPTKENLAAMMTALGQPGYVVADIPHVEVLWDRGPRVIKRDMEPEGSAYTEGEIGAWEESTKLQAPSAK